MKVASRLSLLTILLLAFFGATIFAQEKEDNSGTNPIKYIHDFRVLMEMQSMEGDNSYTKTTFAYHSPLGDKFGLRFRGYKIDLTRGSGPSTFNTSGFGDMDARLLWTAKVTPKRAIVFGTEVVFNTASQPSLGTGKTTLGPQVFLVFFKPFGIEGSLFAPAYQYVFDIAGEDVRPEISRSAIDLFFVLLASDKKHWAIINPQIIIDHENEIEFAIVDVEWGQMMFGTTSSYIRPGFGIGDDAPIDWSIEFGFKVIWK